MSLYRKYRPQTFEDMVGQEHIAQTLRNALSSDPPRVAHAYLFCGPRGTGKTTSARLLAKCLNCEQGPTPTPCNKCEFCTRVRDNQQILDLLELDAASNRSVEDAEEIIRSVSYPPSAPGRRKVYIIDEVHMISPTAFNSLLKTLEEPPPYAVFVLATTEANKVLPTVVSRCHRFDFRRVGPSDIARRLHYVAQHENVVLEDEAAALIARVADGGLRDALSLLEQVIAFSDERVRESDVRLVLGSVSRELLKSLMDSLAERDVNLALSSVEAASEEGVAFPQLVRDLIAYARDGLLLIMGASVPLDDQEKARLSEHARKIGKARLLHFIESLRAAEKEMRTGTDQRLLLELALVRATTDFSSEAAPVREIIREPAPVRDRVAERVIEKPAQRPALRAVEAVAKLAEPPLQVLEEPLEAAEEELQVLEAPVLEAPALEAPPLAHLAREVEPEQFEPEQAEPAAPPESEAGEYDEQDYAEPAPVEVEVEAAAEVSEVEVPEVEAPVVEEVAEPEPEPPAKAPAARPQSKRGRRIHNMEDFEELWHAVFRRFQKKYGVTIAAYLYEAKPVAFTDTEAVLEFNKEFHYEKACEAAKRLPFEEDLNAVLAVPRKLRFRLAAPKPKPTAAPEPEAAAGSEDDEDEDEDVFKVARDLFAAQVMGRSGS